LARHPTVAARGDRHVPSPGGREGYLTKFAERSSARVTTEQHVHGTEENNVAQSIAEHAGELQADMIALCTHGRSGLRRVVSASIAQQVLRRASAPVLLLRARTPPPARLEPLLVPP